MLFTGKRKLYTIHYIFCQDKMQVDQEEGGHQKGHAEHTPEEEIDHTGAKAKVFFPIFVVVCLELCQVWVLCLLIWVCLF